MANTYSFTIGGVDRSRCIIWKSLQIDDEEGSSASQMIFSFMDRDGVGDPSPDDEVIVTIGGTRVFGGHIVRVSINGKGTSVTLEIECIDYTRALDRNLVVESYEGMTDKAIIKDIIDNYCGGTGITYDSVTEGVTINQMTFNYMPVSQCLTEICNLTGRSWYLDYDKDVHYFPNTTTAAPFNIDDNTVTYSDLVISKDNSGLRNRVYVRGSYYLSDDFTEAQVADGEQTVFQLAEKPHDISMTEDSVAKTIGIKNIDSFDDFDYLVNFQEKYIETDVAPAADTVLEFTYKYEIPVLVAVEDKDSIEEFGQFEYAILDNTITNLDQARDRATAELTSYADTLISGSFTTTTDGFRAGQYINIDLTEYDIDDDYLVRSVSARSIGGGEFVYKVSVVSNTALGIIQFLIRLLENDKNFLNITENEVVDELETVSGESFTITDGVPSLTTFEPPFEWDDAASIWQLAEWYEE